MAEESRDSKDHEEGLGGALDLNEPVGHLSPIDFEFMYHPHSEAYDPRRYTLLHEHARICDPCHQGHKSWASVSQYGHLRE